MKSSIKQNSNNEEEDQFFSKVMQYNNSKLNYQTKGNQIFFRSLSMSPARSTQKDNIFTYQNFQHFIPSSSAETAGFFTTRQKFQNQNEEDIIDNNNRIKQYLFRNASSIQDQGVNQQSRSPQKKYFDVSDQIKEAEKGSQSSSASKTQQLERSRGDNEQGNSKSDRNKENNIECIVKNQQNYQNDQNEGVSVNKIAEYTLELKEILKNVQENNSIETVHNRIIREMIQKYFRNIELIPLENYYQSIKEFKEYFQQNLHDLQRSIDQLLNSNKQIKIYEEKLKMFTDDTNIEHFQESSSRNNLNSSSFQDNIQFHSFNPTSPLHNQHYYSSNREGSVNEVQLDTNATNIQKTINANLEQINKQLQIQIDSLLKQLQKQADQKEEEIAFLLEQYSLESKDNENQVKLKQEEIDLILQNHNHISNMYREKIYNLEQQNSHLSNRIEEILSLGLKRENCLQEEVNSLRQTVIVLEKSLLLPANESKMENIKYLDNAYCLNCGSSEIQQTKQISNNAVTNNNYSVSNSKNGLVLNEYNDRLSPSKQYQTQQPLVLTQSTFENSQLYTNNYQNHSKYNATQAEDSSSTQKKKTRNIFLKKNQTQTSLSKQQILGKTSFHENKIQKLGQEGDKQQKNYMENVIQKDSEVINDKIEEQSVEITKQKRDIITYQELQKEFSLLKLTPFNMKIESLNKYFSKLYTSLLNEITVKSNNLIYEQSKQFDKQQNQQLESIQLIISSFQESFNQKAKFVIQKIIEFEKSVKSLQKGKKTESQNQTHQVKDSGNQYLENQELSKQDFQQFISERVHSTTNQDSDDKYNAFEKNLKNCINDINKILYEQQENYFNKKLPIECIKELQEGIDKLLQFNLSQQLSDQQLLFSNFFLYYQLGNFLFNSVQFQQLVNEKKSQSHNQSISNIQLDQNEVCNSYKVKEGSLEQHIDKMQQEEKNQTLNDKKFIKNEKEQLKKGDQFSINHSQNASQLFIDLQSRDRSLNLQSPSLMTPQHSIQKSIIFKQSDKKLIVQKTMKESNKLQSELIDFLSNQFILIQGEFKLMIDNLIFKNNQTSSQYSHFADLSEIQRLLQQILADIKICKDNDQKRFSMDTKVNDLVLMENKTLRKQLLEQKEYYEKELEQAVQNLIIHQEFFDEKKKFYEEMNQQYRKSISILNSEVSRRNNQLQHNHEAIYDEFVKIHNNINSMIRIEKKMMVASSKGNQGAIVAVESLRNEIQNIYTTQNKKLNSLVQIKKKIFDKLQRIETHENLLTDHKMKGKHDAIQQTIQQFEKQNDYLESKLSEEKQGFKYLIKTTQEYYSKLINYLNSPHPASNLNQ